MTSNRYTVTILFIILITGFIVRASTINWGLPDAMQQYSYNLDEGTVLEMFKNFKPDEFNFDTKNYVSGTLGYYLFAGAIFIGSVMGFYDLVPDPGYYREHIMELRYMYIAMRLLIVLFSTLLILVSFHIGKHLIGDDLGLLLAGYISIMPSILANSQYASVQLTLLTAIALSFLFLLRYLKYYKNKDLYLLALFCGLSISIKHSGIFTFVLLGYAIYHGRKQGRSKDWLKTVVISTAIVMMAFAATSPYLVKFRLFQLFFPDINLEADHAGFMWNFDIINMPAFLWRIIKVYFFETGIISLFFVYHLLRRNINRLILPVLLFIVTFHTAVLFTRYGTDSRLLPNGYFIGILSIIGFYEFLKSNTINKNLKIIIIALVLVGTIGPAFAVKYRFLKHDSLKASSRWIEENILRAHDNPLIGLNTAPYFAAPQIITKEWMHNKHPDSVFYPDNYNETFIIPEHKLGVFGGSQILPDRELLRYEKMRWLESKSPDYIIIIFDSSYGGYGGWPEHLEKSPKYQLIRHYPKYENPAVTYLQMWTYDVYIYRKIET
jgi:hypothetical protein